MKIRGRLIVSLLIMIFTPILFTIFCIFFIANNESKILSDHYRTRVKSSAIFTDTFGTLIRITVSEYNDIVHTAECTPAKLHDEDYLKEINTYLATKNSFLVVKRNDQNIYVGNDALYDTLASFPPFSHFEQGPSTLSFIDHSNMTLVRLKDFYFENGDQGQVFLITDLSKLVPPWNRIFIQILFFFAIGIVAIAILLVFWLYQGIIYPLNMLRAATKQIGQGELDMPITPTKDDEIGALCQDFDIMRKHLKDMQEEKEYKAERNRRIIASISHDLQTPITSIKGYAEGIMDGIAATPEMQTKYLQTISNKANELTYLVEELSYLAKMDENALAHNATALNIQGYFTDCANELRLDLSQKNIDLQVINLTSANTTMVANPEQLRRVIQNLVENAIKYTRKEYSTLKITLEYDFASISPKSHRAEKIRITFTDEGIGISEEDLPHVFDIFYRADTSRGSDTGGSGLGLYIVRKIIEAHHGTVSISSTPGEGTSISFTLPQGGQINE